VYYSRRAAMNYRTETPRYSAQVINEQWLRKVAMDKAAAEGEGTAFTREKLRQESFARQILPPIQLQPDELDRDVNDDQPRKIVEKEPDSIAVSIPLKARARLNYFKGPRYEIKFFKIESEHFRKQKHELLTYQNDIRKIISDNLVKDMADQEDKFFLNAVNSICVGNASEQVTSGTWAPTLFSTALRKMVERRRPVGRMLMTDGLYYRAIEFSATQIGFEQAGRHYDKGVESENVLFGIPVVRTIKKDIFTAVDSTNGANMFFIFTPENFLGKFFVIQDATLFIKDEADWIEFWTYEVIGIGIGNTLSVQKVVASS